MSATSWRAPLDGPGVGAAKDDEAPGWLEAAGLRARLRADATGRTQWIWGSVDLAGPGPDALAVFGDQAVLEATSDRVYWAEPGGEDSLAARGTAAVCEAHGPDRFDRVSAFVRDLAADWHDGSEPGAAVAPRLFGGFAFESRSPDPALWRGFPAARWNLPRLLYRRGPRGAGFGACEALEPGDAPEVRVRALWSRLRAAWSADWPDPAPADPARVPDLRIRADEPLEAYRERVRRALEEIQSGGLEKVVLARAIHVEGRGLPRVPALLAALRGLYPSCVHFAFARDDAVFLGATPERLVRLAPGGRVQVSALAGTISRGQSPEEDAALAARLLANPKERAEHAAVVRTVRSALLRRCAEVDGSDEPRVLALEGLQHLETRLEGRLARTREAPGVVELAADLHPTPAVGGLPAPAAADWIRRHEGLERGWYAAPVGHCDLAGEGELRVALRSALLRGSEAHLFAGAGIVAGSAPEGELRETRLKLRALLAPLLEV